jgi:hypothetical protein
MLAEKIEQMEKGPESRVAVVGETKRKRKSSGVKKSKRKYRLLAAEKGDVAGGGELGVCEDFKACEGDVESKSDSRRQF